MENIREKRLLPISVVMPVHNYGQYIKEAIESVLNQTMPDFEFIIVNDGSTDNSSEIAHAYDDPRIRVIDFAENKGCYPARNHGMRLAQGQYICVMDADDICLPKRLETQYAFLNENPDIGLIGSAYQFMNDFHPVYKVVDPEIIRLLLLKYCYLLHPTCMIRHSLVRQYNLYYDENLTYASDYAWQVKASSLFPVSNVNEVLLLYREHENQISNSKSKMQGLFANQVRLHQITSLGVPVKKEEEHIIISFLTQQVSEMEGHESIITKFIADFIRLNSKKRYYSQERLETMLSIIEYGYKRNNDQKEVI